MARRVKTNWKEKQREVEAPEIVEEKLWTLSDWMEKHWKPVLATLGGISVLWAGVGIYQIVSASSEQKRAESTAAVFTKALTPVVPPPPPPAEGAEKVDDSQKNEGPSFATDKERAEAVIKAAGTEDPKAGALIGVLVGGARATTGDYAGQLKAIDGALAKVGGEALEIPLHEQKATALTSLGKTSEAVAEWAKVGSLSPTAFGKALAQVRTGDLYNPNLGAKEADAQKAKSAYEAAVKAARVGDKDPAPGSLAFLVADARLKLERL